MTEPSRSTLDEILNSPDVGLPEHRHPICVAGKLNAEFDRLEDEIEDLLETDAKRRADLARRRRDDDGVERPTGRLGEKFRPNPLLEEKTAEREALRTRMAKHTVELLVRGKPDHEWRAWRDQNPPREDVGIDQKLGFNVDALTETIRTQPRAYVVSINDAGYTDEQWAKIMAAAAPGDMWRLTNVVFSLHGRAVEVPKSWMVSSATTEDGSTSS